MQRTATDVWLCASGVERAAFPSELQLTQLFATLTTAWTSPGSTSSPRCRCRSSARRASASVPRLRRVLQLSPQQQPRQDEAAAVPNRSLASPPGPSSPPTSPFAQHSRRDLHQQSRLRHHMAGTGSRASRASTRSTRSTHATSGSGTGQRRQARRKSGRSPTGISSAGSTGCASFRARCLHQERTSPGAASQTSSTC